MSECKPTLKIRARVGRLGAGWIGGWIGALSIGICVHADEPPTAATSRPNVLVILTDQQSAGMMSCAGRADVKTPHMDLLAARGVRFERAYCANPECVPSRMSLMTGRMPSAFGMRSNQEARLPAPPWAVTHSLGWIFRRAGYRTVYGGKTHWMRGMTPETTGFEDLTRDEREELARRCADFLTAPHDRPFLLVASFINPHDICLMAIDAYTQANGLPPMYPNLVRERECLAEALRPPPGVSKEDFVSRWCPPLPSNFEIPPDEPDGVGLSYVSTFRRYVREHWTEQDWRLHRWAYARLTERVDREIGIVLDALRSTGLESNTIVVLTSDHGELDSAHRLEAKSIPYEEAARVPLIVAGPAVRSPGRTDAKHLVHTGLDLIPTLCDLAGVPAPENLLGLSLRPILEGHTPPSWRSYVVVESRAARMIRSERFKYVVYEEGTNREQLTDLEADPGEMKNLAGDSAYRGVLMQHRRDLAEWTQRIGDSIAAPWLIPPEH